MFQKLEEFEMESEYICLALAKEELHQDIRLGRKMTSSLCDVATVQINILIEQLMFHSILAAQRNKCRMSVRTPL